MMHPYRNFLPAVSIGEPEAIQISDYPVFVAPAPRFAHPSQTLRLGEVPPCGVSIIRLSHLLRFAAFASRGRSPQVSKGRWHGSISQKTTTPTRKTHFHLNWRTPAAVVRVRHVSAICWRIQAMRPLFNWSTIVIEWVKAGALGPGFPLPASNLLTLLQRFSNIAPHVELRRLEIEQMFACHGTPFLLRRGQFGFHIGNRPSRRNH